MQGHCGLAGWLLMAGGSQLLAAVHDWGRAYMTGARVCQRCGLLPLDEDDAALPCEIEETEEWQD